MARTTTIRTPFFTVKKGLERAVCRKNDGTLVEVGPNIVQTPERTLLLRGDGTIKATRTDFDRVEFTKRGKPIDIAVTTEQVVIHTPRIGLARLEW